MLDAFIIEELRRQERLRREQDGDDRPRIELPLEDDQVAPLPRSLPIPKDDPPGQVVVIDL